MTASEFTKIIGLIKGAFPHIDRFKDDDVKDVWYECLEDLDYDKARVATLNAIKSAKDFPPDIATIREEYSKIVESEKHELGEIKRFYEQARSYYPGSGKNGYGWEEWKARAKDKKTAELFYQVVAQYVALTDKTGETPIDFRECIKTICRDNDGKIYFK